MHIVLPDHSFIKLKRFLFKKKESYDPKSYAYCSAKTLNKLSQSRLFKIKSFTDLSYILLALKL